MGRPPKPTALKLVTGNPGKRALNRDEPRPRAGLPTPPPVLNDDAKAEWRRVARDLHQCGLLTLVDRSALAAYCQAYGRWCEAEREIAAYGMTVTTEAGNVIQHPLVGVARRAMTDMVKFAAEFGMTPSARSRVQAQGKGDSKRVDSPARKYF